MTTPISPADLNEPQVSTLTSPENASLATRSLSSTICYPQLDPSGPWGTYRLGHPHKSSNSVHSLAGDTQSADSSAAQMLATWRADTQEETGVIAIGRPDKSVQWETADGSTWEGNVFAMQRKGDPQDLWHLQAFQKSVSNGNDSCCSRTLDTFRLSTEVSAEKAARRLFKRIGKSVNALYETLAADAAQETETTHNSVVKLRLMEKRGGVERRTCTLIRSGRREGDEDSEESTLDEEE